MRLSEELRNCGVAIPASPTANRSCRGRSVLRSHHICLPASPPTPLRPAPSLAYTGVSCRLNRSAGTRAERHQRPKGQIPNTIASQGVFKASSWPAGTQSCRASSAKPCAIFATAARPRSAVGFSNATGADIASSFITRVVTGTVPSARGRLVLDGSRSAKPNFCPSPISTSCSRCLPRSAGSRFRTRDRSTPSCFAPPQPLCSKPPPIPDYLVHPSASLPCCIPGDRTSICIHTCIA